jgi:hypothetical protein
MSSGPASSECLDYLYFKHRIRKIPSCASELNEHQSADVSLHLGVRSITDGEII